MVSSVDQVSHSLEEFENRHAMASTVFFALSIACNDATRTAQQPRGDTNADERREGSGEVSADLTPQAQRRPGRLPGTPVDLCPNNRLAIS